MHRFLTRAILGAIFIAVPVLVQAHNYTLGSLFIDQLWARATPNGAEVAGAYVRITNKGTEPDKLIGASLQEAGKGEVHEMSMDGGIMKMREVAGGLVIKPGETVELKPGGYHLMFHGLKTPLKEGEMAHATLVFEKAGKLDVTLHIKGIAAMGPSDKQAATPPAHDAMGGMKHDMQHDMKH